MIILTRINIDRNYFIMAIAYHIYHRSIDTCEGMTKKEARKILRDTVYHAGRSNWPGMHNQVTDILGEFEAFDKYQECERISEIFINHNFPNFK